jgi:adenylate cyclase
MTLKVKLCLLIIGLLILTILGAGILLILYEKETLYSLIKGQGEALVKDLAQTSAQSLLNDDDLVINTLIKNAGQRKYVEAIFIVDTNNIIRAHSDARLIGTKFSLPIEFKEFSGAQNQVLAQPYVTPKGVSTIYFLQPISYNNLNLGSIHLELSQGVINMAVQESVRRIVLLLAAAIVFGSIAALGLASLISNPISRLIEGTKAIAEGDYRYQIPVKSHDEIGVLTSAFNTMVQTLKHKEQVERAFGKYVSRQVAELILKDPNVYVGGVKQQATVMFADIRGFTPLSEIMPPEQVVELLNRYFTVMTRVIFDYNGLLDKFIGDAVMAVFGMPLIEQGIHAEMAVRAALRMQEEIQALGAQLLKEGKKPVGVGIGINSGEMVAGNMGSMERLEYTVIGYDVNIASRLESVAHSGQILITETVYQKVKNLVEVIKLPPVQVKGRVKPLNIYEVLRLKQPTLRLGVVPRHN